MIAATSFSAATLGCIGAVLFAVLRGQCDAALAPAMAALAKWSSSRRPTRARLWLRVIRNRRRPWPRTFTSSASSATASSAADAQPSSCSSSFNSRSGRLRALLGLLPENFLAFFYLTFCDTGTTSLTPHNYLLVRCHIAGLLQSNFRVLADR